MQYCIGGSDAREKGCNKVCRNDPFAKNLPYGVNGNRLSVARGGIVDSGRYDAQDRLVEYAGDQYVYTKAAYLRYKISGADTTSYTYDAYGNLLAVRLPNGDQITCLIDATNRRIGKMVNGLVTATYVYAADLTPVAALDSSGEIVERYVYGTHVNIPDYIVRDSAVYRQPLDGPCGRAA